LDIIVQVFPHLLQIAKAILKCFFLLGAGLERIEKLLQAHAAFHPRPEGKEMSQRPGLHIKQVSILLAASERSALIEELRQRDAGLCVEHVHHVPVARRSSDISTVALEASVAVKLRKAFVKPGGEPAEIQVKQAVNVLVIHHTEPVGIVTIVVDHIQAYHGKLPLPPVNVEARGLGPGMQPEFGNQLLGGRLIQRCQD
jgi:hypothetical protein